MKQNTYCLVGRVPELYPLWNILRSLREKLIHHSIPHHIPSLNWHITYVSPFLATELEMEWLVLGLELGRTEQNLNFLSKTTYIDFFKNKDTDALVLRIESSQKLRETIERARIKIEKLTDLKFMPTSFQVNFHATIAEAPKLLKHIEEAGGVPNLFGDARISTTVHLPNPTVMQKKSEGWVPVSL